MACLTTLMTCALLHGSLYPPDRKMLTLQEPPATPPGLQTVESRPAEDDWQLQMGAGFSSDPDTALLALRLDRRWDDRLRVGPLLQLGWDDDRRIIAPSLNFRRSFTIGGEEGGFWSRLEPYVEGGVGFARLEEDHRRGDDDDTGILFPFGFGADMPIGPRTSVGAGVLFNFLPDEVLDERFFFSCRLLSLTLRF